MYNNTFTLSLLYTDFKKLILQKTQEREKKGEMKYRSRKPVHFTNLPDVPT
jgi:hypothetical protein